MLMKSSFFPPIVGSGLIPPNPISKAVSDSNATPLLATGSLKKLGHAARAGSLEMVMDENIGKPFFRIKRVELTPEKKIPSVETVKHKTIQIELLLTQVKEKLKVIIDVLSSLGKKDSLTDLIKLIDEVKLSSNAAMQLEYLKIRSEYHLLFNANVADNTISKIVNHIYTCLEQIDIHDLTSQNVLTELEKLNVQAQALIQPKPMYLPRLKG
jgi:hypothetical protein